MLFGLMVAPRIGSREVLAVAITALSTGLVAWPFTLIEVLAARRPPTAPRDIVAAVTAGLVVFLGAVLGSIEAVYAFSVAEQGDPSRALAAIGDFVDRTVRAPGRSILLVVALGASPFVPLFVARLRGLTLGRQVFATLAGTIPVGGPFLIYIGSHGGKHEMEAFVVATVAIAAFAPLTLAAADALERRIARWLES